uniref:Uncharacterized protein n=1 Tax=Romanomermis culicivorax TaxID=13658 RepID=A0A915IB48_ROMCU
MKHSCFSLATIWLQVLQKKWSHLCCFKCLVRVGDWMNFTKMFPVLEKKKFEPFCPKCLETDENFKPDLQTKSSLEFKNVKNFCISSRFKISKTILNASSASKSLLAPVQTNFPEEKAKIVALGISSRRLRPGKRLGLSLISSGSHFSAKTIIVKDNFYPHQTNPDAPRPPPLLPVLSMLPMPPTGPRPNPARPAKLDGPNPDPGSYENIFNQTDNG